jgi:hypothetical protein
MEMGISKLEPPEGVPRQEYNLLKANVMTATRQFSTPNAENTRNLLMRVGFDPSACWSWRNGQEVVTPRIAAERLNGWLQVRHAIAHGDADWPDVDVLPQLPNGSRTLRLKDCDRLIRFSDRLARRTVEGFHDSFS